MLGDNLIENHSNFLCEDSICIQCVFLKAIHTNTAKYDPSHVFIQKNHLNEPIDSFVNFKKEWENSRLNDAPLLFYNKKQIRANHDFFLGLNILTKCGIT